MLVAVLYMYLTVVQIHVAVLYVHVSSRSINTVHEAVLDNVDMYLPEV